MKANLIRLLSVALVSLAAGSAFLRSVAAGEPFPSALTAFAHQAVSKNPADSEAAIKALREAGPAGMRALSQVHTNEIARHQRNKASQSSDVWARLCAAFDAVGQQRDDYASQLYWYTNLEQAKVAARAAGKPILSLRLLGKLNEEFSCANSRFFRTTLYPNAEVSQYLREHFILHWQSVRPVPRITIDLGDGRKIERTITGNSIHYILDTEGRPVDALPGLYGAKAFLEDLERARDAAQQCSKLDETQRTEFLKRYHAAQFARIEQDWTSDLVRIETEPLTGFDAHPAKHPDASVEEFLPNNALSARLMGRAAIAGATAAKWRQLAESTSDDTWRQIAALHAEEVRLDQDALALISAKQPTIEDAMRLATTKGIVETPMMRVIQNLKHSIAEDTVRNEYELHARLHDWFAQGVAPENLDVLNAKVYAQIFLTPESDPWLGLAPADVYSALDHGGLVEINPPASPRP